MRNRWRALMELWIKLGKSDLLDAARISRAIEFTRFPVPEPDDKDDEDGSLARAANLIGQLGAQTICEKPMLCIMNLTKSASTSHSATLVPAELMDLYPHFYFNNVSPYLKTAIRYLNVTSSGRMWIANLYSNIFRAQRELRLSGPQH